VERVREASDHDVDRLVELTAAFHADRGHRRGAGSARPSDGGGNPPEATVGDLSRYVGGPGRAALVGTLDGWVAGAALCRVDPGPGDRRGVLDLCFVEPDAREVGLGQLLLDGAVEWFRGQRCSGVDGSALPGDRGAKQFYESAGFKARLLVMHLALD
jgi:GNAT superfamily N-acetyltransferase